MIVEIVNFIVVVLWILRLTLLIGNSKICEFCGYINCILGENLKQQLLFFLQWAASHCSCTKIWPKYLLCFSFQYFQKKVNMMHQHFHSRRSIDGADICEDDDDKKNWCNLEELIIWLFTSSYHVFSKRGNHHHEKRWKLSEWANIGLPLNRGQNCWILNLPKIPLWAWAYFD